jgi:hypothetical protein
MAAANHGPRRLGQQSPGRGSHARAGWHCGSPPPSAGGDDRHKGRRHCPCVACAKPAAGRAAARFAPSCGPGPWCGRCRSATILCRAGPRPRRRQPDVPRVGPEPPAGAAPAPWPAAAAPVPPQTLVARLSSPGPLRHGDRDDDVRECSAGQHLSSSVGASGQRPGRRQVPRCGSPQHRHRRGRVRRSPRPDEP